ncbi:NAD(+) synthase [Acetoanaerobium noterae]|uniref:NAD(+) synthase n=1 Tax=Acetoanaerobium noterae TaxID=745369 RepID=UPI0033318888
MKSQYMMLEIPCMKIDFKNSLEGMNIMNYEFDAVKVRDEIIKWLRDFKESTGLTKVVLGISGGKDSTVVAALCARAYGRENVYGILMPNGDQIDIADSHKVCEALGINSRVINIKPVYEAELAVLESTGDEISVDAKINIAPRIRMMTLYAWGQSHHCRVCGTGNLSELTLGYFTKYGDGGVDFNPIANLTSVEVVAIGDTLEELPYDLVHKTPTDGLSGKSDEERLGLKYDDVHKYIRKLELDNQETVEKIKKLEKAALHKRTPIPTFSYNK